MNLKDTQEKAKQDLAELSENSERELATLRKNAEKEMAEIRADFPAIARLNRKIAGMLEEIRSYGNLRLEELNPESYAKFSPEQRDEILLHEIAFNALAVYDYGKVEALQDSAAEAFVTFGHFYGARYKHDQLLHASSLQRALLYLEQALESGRDGVATRVRSAFGVLYIWQSAKEENPQKREKMFADARRHLDAVLAGDRIDARCLLAAAWLDRREDRMPEALKRLDRVIQAGMENKLPEEQRDRFPEQAHFNRGCYHALMGDTQKALQDLRASRRIAQMQGNLPKWVRDLKGSVSDLQAVSVTDFIQLSDVNYVSPEPRAGLPT